MRGNNLIFTGDEYHFRLGIFLSTSRYIKEFNSKRHSFRLGLNHLSHLTESEYNSLLGTRVPKISDFPRAQSSYNDVPDSIDWRQLKVVNPVQDQGQCGSCWAFAAVQVAESYWALKSSELIKFSESNIVDCVDVCSGCSGGWSSYGLEYVRRFQHGYFNLLSDYQYVPVTGDCKFDLYPKVGGVGSIDFAFEYDENDLKSKVGTIGVAAISIDAGHPTFHNYQGGIYDEPACSSTQLDHGVGLVGYGTENNIDYWIVRNSWGNIWGEHGYIRMIRNKDNQCGVATVAFVLID